MKKKAVLIFLVFFSLNVGSWGLTGHRVVGDIAEQYLSKKAKKQIKKILGTESLADVANWMDFIKSEPSYDAMKPWHYCTIPKGKTYEQAGTPKEKDIIWALKKFRGDLESDTTSRETKQIALKGIVHLIGDLHQPLHVGNGTDRGGNDVKVKYFYQNSNLHRVWDSQMIDGQNLSYTEWVKKINHITTGQVATWQQGTVLDWAYESQTYHPSVYDIGEKKSLSYRYNYDHLAQVEERLLKAGVRLAGYLNAIYD